MKARLIKQGKRENPARSKAPKTPPAPKVKSTVAVVREWVGQHQKVKHSARQAFAALFAEAEMRRVT